MKWNYGSCIIFYINFLGTTAYFFLNFLINKTDFFSHSSYPQKLQF